MRRLFKAQRIQTKIARQRPRVGSPFRQPSPPLIENLEARQLLASIHEYPLASGAFPAMVAAGPDGDLWMAEQGLDQIARLSPSGGLKEFALPSGSEPYGIAAGSDGNLWFTEQGSNQIGRITPAGVVTQFNLPTSSAQPSGIVAGPDGALWFTETAVDQIGRISTGGTITEIALSTGSHPYGITVGPDNALWFTENAADTIGRITTASVITLFPVTSGSLPYGITTGSDGNLWFTEQGAAKIGQLTTGGTLNEFSIGSGNIASEIVAGPNGDLFFTEFSSGAIGDMSTSGTVVGEYPSPTSGSLPSGIAIGPDHHVWASEDITDLAARLNFAPTTKNSNFTTAAGSSLNTAAGAVLAGATDPENDPLTSVLVTGTSHGSLTLNANGSFSYTPNSGYTGADSFTFKASDGFDTSNSSTVSITVSASQPPVANNDSYTGNENTVLSENAANGVLANDTDPSGKTLTAILQSQPAHGSLTLNSDGSFTYTPNNNFVGSDSFTYRASDGTLTSNVATVSLTINRVNQAPVAVNDSYSVVAGHALSINAIIGVLANDADPDGDSLTAVLVATTAHGTLSLNTSGSFTYTPNSGFSGTDTFSYQASDGSLLSNTATVTVTVAPNTSPAAVNDSYTASENNALSENAAAGVLANDSDPDGDSLTAVLASQPTHGSLTFNSNGSFTYTPQSGFAGADSFNYRASDGVVTSNLATVSITVIATGPIANNDSYSIVQNQTLTKNATAGVLANDTDPNNQMLMAMLVSGPSNGSLTLNMDGSFIYTPTSTFVGTDSFTYQASDGANMSNVATVTLTVTPNLPPVAVNDSYTTNENVAITKNAASGVLANDSDLDGDALAAALVNGPSHGALALNPDGSFTYTPTANFFGTDSFTYKASDGLLQSNAATVTLTVTQVNQPPIAVNDHYISTGESITVSSPGVLSNDTDPQNDPLTAVLVSTTSHGVLSLSANGSFTYTPSAGYQGRDSFTYKASNGAFQSNTATVSLTVTSPANLPIARNDAYITSELTPIVLAAPGILANDTNKAAAPFTAILVTGPAHGQLTLNPDGSFAYTPASLFFGTDSFTYRASNSGTSPGGDALLSNLATVTITVTHIALPTTTSLLISTPTGVIGQTLSFTASVSAAAGTPAGTVRFQDGTTLLGTATLSAGQATFQTSNLALGSHSIVAVYGGSPNYAAGSSTTAPLSINQATVSVLVSSNAQTILFGQKLKFVATLAVASPGRGTPTGTIIFFDGNPAFGGQPISGPIPVVGGMASVSPPTMAAGPHAMFAVYSGDTNFQGATSLQYHQIINRVMPTAIVSSSSPRAVHGTLLTFTVTFTLPPLVSGSPDGLVTFFDGDPNAGGTIIGSAQIASGSATVSTSTLRPGQHQIFAVYTGSFNYLPITGIVSQLVV
jgi:VCBS repeat-containing protein